MKKYIRPLTSSDSTKGRIVSRSSMSRYIFLHSSNFKKHSTRAGLKISFNLGISSKKYMLLLSYCLMIFSIQPFSIILDPSQNNRTIGSEYEKRVTALYGESIRDHLFTLDNQGTFELTRGLGETLEPLEAATFSNVLNPNLHISLQCYSSERTEIFIYYMKWHGIDAQEKTSKKLQLIPASHSYCYNFDASKKYAETLYALLQEKYGTSVSIHKPIGCPCKPLFGITSPAITLELGIPTDTTMNLAGVIAETMQELTSTLERAS